MRGNATGGTTRQNDGVLVAKENAGERKSWFGTWVLFPLLLALLTAIVFHEAPQAGFLDYDDPDYVTDNPHVQAGITRDGIAWAFTTTHAANWHPLTWLSHMLDSTLFGLNPGGHHAVSLVFHLANTLLLYFLWRGMTGRRGNSFILAALFAVHPLHVESVLWVAERKDVLSTFLCLLTLAFYLAYVRRMTRARYVGTFVFFTVGLLAKPMYVTLPFTLLLLDFWPLGRFGRRDRQGRAAGTSVAPRRLVLEKVPLLLPALASGLITIVAQRAGGEMNSSPFSQRFMNALLSYAAYLGKTFLPTGLSVFYPYPQVPHHLGNYLVAAGLLLVLTVTAWRCSGRRPALLAGWGWYLITLLPVIGLVQVGDQALADRYTYVPLIGVFFAIVWSASDALTAVRRGRTAGVAAATVCIILLGFVAARRVGDWHDSVRLFRSALAVNSENWRAHENLGMALDMEGGNLEEVIFHYRESIRLNPGRHDVHNALGVALGRVGRIQESILAYLEAVRLKPAYAEAWFNLGIMYIWSGNVPAAAEVSRRLQLIDVAMATRLEATLGMLRGSSLPR